MNPLERVFDPDAVLREALSYWQGGLWTALPAVVESFDADTNTCSVTPTVMAQVRARGPSGALTGAFQNVRMPKLSKCPVQFPRGGGLVLTFPIASGDEGLVVFASRCIDGWWESGEISPQAEIRMHDLSDGFFIPGCSSKPNAVSGVSGTGIQLRNADGSVFVEVTPTGVNIQGVLTINGVPYLAHTHSGVTTGGGSSGPVNP